VRPAALARLAAAGDHRAVIVSTSGRASLLAGWAGARAGRRPLILWASLWAHPRSPAHLASYLPLRRLYRSADAVVTYGPHVSAYVRARGAHNVHVAPQAVDNAYWGAADVGPPQLERWPADAGVRFLFAGRDAPEKGADVLERAWRSTAPSQAVLIRVGGGPPSGADAGVVDLGRLSADSLREVYAACDALVIPSVATATFREPWGLVANEAMNRGLPVIASDAVGADAGGLVRDGVTGLVVRAGDVGALAAAISDLAGDPSKRARLGAAAREAVAAYTYEAWADGFSRALSTVGQSRALSTLGHARERW
jgi:glycosyltransferase involved in cell wall biosynthesis